MAYQVKSPQLRVLQNRGHIFLIVHDSTLILLCIRKELYPAHLKMKVLVNVSAEPLPLRLLEEIRKPGNQSVVLL